ALSSKCRLAGRRVAPALIGFTWDAMLWNRLEHWDDAACGQQSGFQGPCRVGVLLAPLRLAGKLLAYVLPPTVDDEGDGYGLIDQETVKCSIIDARRFTWNDSLQIPPGAPAGSCRADPSDHAGWTHQIMPSGFARSFRSASQVLPSGF